MLGISSFTGVGIAMRPAAAINTRRPGSSTFIPVRAAQVLQGKVISHSTKTAVVAVDKWGKHPVYQKRVKRTTKYVAHDEDEVCKEGDIVLLKPSRPMSKKKRFIVEAIGQGN